MALSFVSKRIIRRPATYVAYPEETVVKEETLAAPKQKNKKNKKDDTMDITLEQVSAAEAAAENIAPEIKRVKKDRGLIERTESSKIILAEDNRQVLND